MSEELMKDFKAWWGSPESLPASREQAAIAAFSAGWNARKPGPATSQVMAFARAVTGPGGEAWSKESRAMFAAFLAEHEAGGIDAP